MDELSRIAEQALQALEARHKAREGALGVSRRLIRHSANTIRAVHRGEFEKAQQMLVEGREVVEQVKADLAAEPNVYASGYVQDALSNR